MASGSVTGKILSYIEANPNQNLTLERLAKELHYSKYYMARTFKKDTGMTLCKYIQGRRLEAAARELAETKRPVVEIALEAGYGSQQAFTRAFRREYGCTPWKYRRVGVFSAKYGRFSLRMNRQKPAAFAAYERSRMAA